jgi:hypothetical protein
VSGPAYSPATYFYPCRPLRPITTSGVAPSAQAAASEASGPIAGPVCKTRGLTPGRSHQLIPIRDWIHGHATALYHPYGADEWSASFSCAPSGITPASTSRHTSTINRRATATIPIFRAR